MMRPSLQRLLKPRTLLWAALPLTLVIVAVAAAATVASAPGPPQYIALGDSLAASMQPDEDWGDHSTDQGYVQVISRRLGIRARSLSCGGAVTGTVRFGGAGCQPPGQPGQLARAVAFLQRNPGTRLVTIEIGDNDVERCISEDQMDAQCIAGGMAAISRNLPVIARRIVAAAGPHTQVVGIVDYDQFLAYWLDGSAGQRAARRSLRVIDAMNARMKAIYEDAGVTLADGGGRFAIDDMTSQRDLPGYGTVPLGVYRTCQWTWACSGPALVSDDHANAAGYRQLARAVLDTLDAPAG